jgi:hypothetical protein
VACLTPDRQRAIVLISWKTMKTTLDLPDELMRSVKIRAVQENRKLKDMVADLLRRGLAVQADAVAPVRQRVRLPLVRCTRRVRPRS